MDQLVLKHIHDLLLSCLLIWYDDAIGSACSDANHFLKCRVLEGLNWLYGAVRLDAAKSEQWLCSTATAPNRKSENMFLAGGGDFAFLTRVYNSL